MPRRLLWFESQLPIKAGISYPELLLIETGNHSLSELHLPPRAYYIRRDKHLLCPLKLRSQSFNTISKLIVHKVIFRKSLALKDFKKKKKKKKKKKTATPF